MIAAAQTGAGTWHRPCQRGRLVCSAVTMHLRSLQQQLHHTGGAWCPQGRLGVRNSPLRPCTTPALAVAGNVDPLAASIVAAAEQPDFTGVTHSRSVPCTKQQLLDIAATYVKLWFSGIAKGPQAVEQELAMILSPEVLIKADRVKHFQDTHGLHEVLAELERAHLEYHRSEHRPMLYAASPETQRAYALVEGTYQDVGALPGHPATFRISKVHHILSMEVQDGRIKVLWLYRQLTEEDKDELLREPLSCYPAPFPRDSLTLADPVQHASQSSTMVDTVRSWWQGWASGPVSGQASANGSGSNGTSATAVADSHKTRSRSRTPAVGHLLAPDFKIWDAYGLWPAMRAQGRRYLSKDAAVRYMQSLSYSFSIELKVLDIAVAEGSLACFSHWQARLVPRWQAEPSSTPGEAAQQAPPGGTTASTSSSSRHRANTSGSHAAPVQQQISSSTAPQPQPQQAEQAQHVEPDGAMLVDGMAVDLFDEGMRLKVIWVFRGPVSQQEQQLFLVYDQQQAAAEAAQAASNQDAIRAARRAQREQQLSELLAWMNNYQQQWSSYVSHVQKQIARQQRLAKQELIRQLQESQSLEASIEEEEEVQQQQQQLGQQLQEQLVQAQQQLQNLQQQAQQQLQNLQQQAGKGNTQDRS